MYLVKIGTYVGFLQKNIQKSKVCSLIFIIFN